MKVVVDRLVQYPNRFQLVNVSTGAVLGVFDLSAVTGTIQQVGTEIDAELFQSIQDDLTKLAQDIVAESNARGVDIKALQDSIVTKITANGGELGNAVVSFNEVSNATNIASGEKASTLFGKIKNWFGRLKALAFKDTIADVDISANANISQSKVNGLTEIQSKVNGIESGANKYVLPVSSATKLGGVKIGNGLSVSNDGTISAVSQTENSYTTSEKTKLSSVEENANNYSLPVSTATQLGGVKVGARLSMASDGVLQADVQSDMNFTREEKNKLAKAITNTGTQEFYKDGAVDKVVIHDSDWDGIAVKSIENPDQKTALSKEYVWVQANASDVATLNADGFLVYDASAPNGKKIKFPKKADGSTSTLATEDDILVKSVNGQTGDITINVPKKVSELQNDSQYMKQSDYSRPEFVLKYRIPLEMTANVYRWMSEGTGGGLINPQESFDELYIEIDFPRQDFGIKIKAYDIRFCAVFDSSTGYQQFSKISLENNVIASSTSVSYNLENSPFKFVQDANGNVKQLTPIRMISVSKKSYTSDFMAISLPLLSHLRRIETLYPIEWENFALISATDITLSDGVYLNVYVKGGSKS